jgi:transposase
MEATGYSRWFQRLLTELGFELWIGNPAEIKAKRIKKQKTDRNDAQLLLRPMRENNFPQIWVPSPENRDLRQLLWHRHRLVQMRTRIMNQLQALAMNEGQAVQLAPHQMREVIEALQALRGIAKVSAVTIVAELGDKVITAVGRELLGFTELLGFIWAIGVKVEAEQRKALRQAA